MILFVPVVLRIRNKKILRMMLINVFLIISRRRYSEQEKNKYSRVDRRIMIVYHHPVNTV